MDYCVLLYNIILLVTPLPPSLWYAISMPTKSAGPLEKGKAMTRYSRPRGALGYLLDTNKLAQAIREVLGSKDWEWDIEPYKAALVYGEGTKWAVVNDEGVGSQAEDYDQAVIVNYGLSKESDENENARTINLFVQEVELPWSVIDQCRTGEPIDLADHVRTFGHRLDNNHAIWYRFSDKVLENA